MIVPVVSFFWSAKENLLKSPAVQPCYPERDIKRITFNRVKNDNCYYGIQSKIYLISM